MLSSLSFITLTIGIQQKDTHVVLVQLILLLSAQADKFLENISLVLTAQQEYLDAIKMHKLMLLQNIVARVTQAILLYKT